MAGGIVASLGGLTNAFIISGIILGILMLLTVLPIANIITQSILPFNPLNSAMALIMWLILTITIFIMDGTVTSAPDIIGALMGVIN